MEKHLAIRTLAASHKENQIVTSSESRDIRHTVSHLPADGIEALEPSIGSDVVLDILDDPMELVQALRRL